MVAAQLVRSPDHFRAALQQVRGQVAQVALRIEADVAAGAPELIDFPFIDPGARQRQVRRAGHARHGRVYGAEEALHVPVGHLVVLRTADAVQEQVGQQQPRDPGQRQGPRPHLPALVLTRPGRSGLGRVRQPPQLETIDLGVVRKQRDVRTGVLREETPARTVAPKHPQRQFDPLVPHRQRRHRPGRVAHAMSHAIVALCRVVVGRQARGVEHQVCGEGAKLGRPAQRGNAELAHAGHSQRLLQGTPAAGQSVAVHDRLRPRSEPGLREGAQQGIVRVLVQARDAREELVPRLARHRRLAFIGAPRVEPRHGDVDAAQAGHGDLGNRDVRGFRKIRINRQEYGAAARVVGQGMRRDGLGEHAGVKELGLVPGDDHRTPQPQPAPQVAAPRGQRPVEQGHAAGGRTGGERRAQRGCRRRDEDAQVFARRDESSVLHQVGSMQ